MEAKVGAGVVEEVGAHGSGLGMGGEAGCVYDYWLCVIEAVTIRGLREGEASERVWVWLLTDRQSDRKWYVGWCRDPKGGRNAD